jgi:hypothetical protein
MSAEPPPLFAEPPAAPAEHMNDSAWRDGTDETGGPTSAADSNTATLEPEPEVRARYARFVVSDRPG